jgi:SdpC family antimicrobial peptide
MLCFVLASWGSIANNNKLTYHLTGEEMFRGVFFVEGQYAELIPELKAAQTAYLSDELTPQENAALTAVRNQLVDAIKADNPAYFDDFKFALQTASPEVVKEKIIEAQKLLADKAIELSNISKAELKEDIKATEAFMAKQGNSVDKNAMKKFMSEMAKSNTAQANTNSAMCIAIALILLLIVVKVAVIPYTDEEAVVSKSSNFMLEQIVGSVCSVANQVV